MAKRHHVRTLRETRMVTKGIAPDGDQPDDDPALLAALRELPDDDPEVVAGLTRLAELRARENEAPEVQP